MIKKINILFILLSLFVATLFYSCSKENPVGYGINQIWGTTDYIPYDWYFNWQYQVDIPADSSQYELWYYVFGKEYIEPYSGWQIAIIYDGVPSGYYYLNANPGDGIYNSNPYGRVWWLTYEFPFIVGNRWHSETIVLDTKEREWRREIDVKILNKEDMDVIAGNYENCIKLYIKVTNSLVDITANDSSYYYEMHEWYAPNVGLVKEEIFDSDIEEWIGIRYLLKRKFTEPFTGGSGSLQSESIKRVSQRSMGHRNLLGIRHWGIQKREK
jgi:hypothetical protein